MINNMDALPHARTPTEADSTLMAEWWEAGIGPNDMAQSLLHRAAPRILALAYREAAVRLRLLEIYGPSRHAIAGWLEALATALEEGTPE